MTCKAYKLRRETYNAMSLNKEAEKALMKIADFLNALKEINSRSYRLVPVIIREGCEIIINIKKGNPMVKQTRLYRDGFGNEIWIVIIDFKFDEGEVNVYVECPEANEFRDTYIAEEHVIIY